MFTTQCPNGLFAVNTDQFPSNSSFVGRLSRLATRTARPETRTAPSRHTSGGFTVPFVLRRTERSATREPVRADNASVHSDSSMRSMPGRMNNTTINQQRLTVPASSVYSQSPRHGYETRLDLPTRQNSTSQSSIHAAEEGRSLPDTSLSDMPSQSTSQKQAAHSRRRGRVSMRQQIQDKKRLSVCFGIVLVIAFIIYIALAASGAGRGAIFHVFSVLFILCLLGVFAHSLLLMIMLKRARKNRLPRRKGSWEDRSRSGTSHSGSSRSRSTAPSSERSFHNPAQPIHITSVEDDDDEPAGVHHAYAADIRHAVRPPPPIYGRHRESRRIDPNLVQLQPVVPSPHTPSYEQALHGGPPVSEFQPPLYASPEKMRTHMSDVEQDAEHQDPARSSDMHPLERQRFNGLLGNTMSSRFQTSTFPS